MGRSDRELPWPADHRDVEGLEVESSLAAIPDDGPEEAKGGSGRATLDPSREAVEGNLGDHLARLAAALPKAAIVKDQGGDVGHERDARPVEPAVAQHDPLGLQTLVGAKSRSM
jgi:hypothetical protein